MCLSLRTARTNVSFIPEKNLNHKFNLKMQTISFNLLSRIVLFLKYFHYDSGSQPGVRVPLGVRKQFAGVRQISNQLKISQFCL